MLAANTAHMPAVAMACAFVCVCAWVEVEVYSYDAHAQNARACNRYHGNLLAHGMHRLVNVPNNEDKQD